MKSIYKGLIKTYPVQFTKRYLSKYIPSIGMSHYLVDYTDDTIFIKLVSTVGGYRVTPDNIKDIIKVLNTCGYFPSVFRLYNKNDIETSMIKYLKDSIDDIFKNDFHMMQIEAEAKFNVKLKVPDKLYHITELKNLKRIESIGLSPNKRAHHPDRIYLGFTEIGCINLASQFDKNNTYVFKSKFILSFSIIPS